MSDHVLAQIIAWPPAGRYIVAVSGGVDSVCLLDLLVAQVSARHYELVVAHADHALRPDSARDQELVRQAARRYDLPFATTTLQLPNASEATARAARYGFLRRVMAEHQARAIITAHTLDDQLETLVFAALRTQSGRGLLGIQPGEDLVRPLLGVSKNQLLDYAREQQLGWHDDSTNAETTYARNAIRHHVLPAITQHNPRFAQTAQALAGQLALTRQQLTQAITTWLATNAEQTPTCLQLGRRAVLAQESPVVAEIIAQACYQRFPGIELTAERLHEAARFAKTARSGRVELGQGLSLTVTSGFITLSIARPPQNR